jgi:membrane protease YdiL (CAAX protease family)
MRRIRSVDFQTVLPRAAGGQALIISAVVFGLCQGVFWMPGMITGVIFGLLYMRTGRLGEAVAAHVTGNALIAAMVLGGAQWQLW